MKGYKTSKDYTHLKELVEKGQDVVCFVTWDFDFLNSEPHEPMMVTDVCYCRYFQSSNPEYTHYSFSSRGHGFGDYWPSMDDGRMTFEDLCGTLFLEYIEPNENENTESKIDHFWDDCNKCEFFDGYDMCLRKGNFGSVTNEKKDRCIRNNYFLEKK